MASIVGTSALLLGALLLVPTLFGDFAAYQIGLFLIYAIAAQGIGFLWGKTGVLPLGQAMFFGMAAYACAHILKTTELLALQLILLAFVVLTLFLIGFTIAYLVFKGRSESGPYFSLITLALVMISEQIAGTATSLTGGFNGLSGFSTLANLDQYSSLYYLVAVTAVLSTACLGFLDRLPAGLVANAVADNEKRMQLLGFPTHVIKGLVFGLSAGFAAIAGILFTNHQGIVTPTSTGFMLSASLVIWTAVGGRYHVYGPMIGAVGIGYLSSELRNSFIYWEIAIALLFIVVVLKAPGGIAGFLAGLTDRLLPTRHTTQFEYQVAPGNRAESDRTPLVFSNAKIRMGAVQILNGVNLSTPETGIVCVIGPNGAGKTSLLNGITGNLSLYSGGISMGGNSIHNRPPHRALFSGISRKLQVPSVFMSLSVRENLALAVWSGRAKFSDYLRLASLSWSTPELIELINSRSLPVFDDLNKSVSELAQGHRQFLEFAMTTTAQPRLLLLDEPCAGLSPDETRQMTELVRTFQQTNQGLIILIEHDMSIVRELADRVVVLHQGATLFEGSYAEVQTNSSVQAVYAGGTK